MSAPLSPIDGGVAIDVVVTPRASRSRVAGVHDGRVRVQVAAPPVDGAANEEVVRVVARVLGVAVAAVRVRSGATGRRKRLEVIGVDVDTVRGALGLA